MSRLIDAVKLIEEAKKLHVDDYMLIQAMVLKQPIAYDVEKVVAEMKEKAEKYNERAEFSRLTKGNLFCVTENYRAMGMREAIDIVRKGGVSDETN